MAGCSLSFTPELGAPRRPRPSLDAEPRRDWPLAKKGSVVVMGAGWGLRAPVGRVCANHCPFLCPGLPAEPGLPVADLQRPPCGPGAAAGPGPGPGTRPPGEPRGDGRRGAPAAGHGLAAELPARRGPGGVHAAEPLPGLPSAAPAQPVPGGHAAREGGAGWSPSLGSVQPGAEGWFPLSASHLDALIGQSPCLLRFTCVCFTVGVSAVTFV